MAQVVYLTQQDKKESLVQSISERKKYLAERKKYLEKIKMAFRKEMDQEEKKIRECEEQLHQLEFQEYQKTTPKTPAQLVIERFLEEAKKKDSGLKWCKDMRNERQCYVFGIDPGFDSDAFHILYRALNRRDGIQLHYISDKPIEILSEEELNVLNMSGFDLVCCFKKDYGQIADGFF